MCKAIIEGWNELFGKPLNKDPLNKDPLNKGDKYLLSTKNPFNKDIIVTIVETKRGYVKYQFSHGSYYSSKISYFLAIYSKVE